MVDEKISIVLPCYNHAEFVDDAIMSVLNQTYRNFELFIYDNGSSDDSWDRISKYDDTRIIKKRLLKNCMLEVKQDFIKNSIGKYIAIMYSDDFWEPTKLEKQVQFLEENEIARICFTGYEFVDENLKAINSDASRVIANRSPKEWWRQLLYSYNCIPCPALLCEREIYEKYMGQVYPYRQIADLYGWMMILQETNIFFVEEVLIKLRQHHSGVNKNESAGTAENIKRGCLEMSMMVYKLILDMEDNYFLDNLCENKNKRTHMIAMCEKMMFLIDRAKKSLDDHRNAVRFYSEHYNDVYDGERFGDYLGGHYGFTRNNFFDFEIMETYSNSVEALQNRAFKLLENSDFMNKKFLRPIYIYGCGHIGKALYKRINRYAQVLGFIETNLTCEQWNSVKIYSIKDMIIESDSMIVVTPIQDFELIVERIVASNPTIAKSSIISVLDFLSS